MLSYLPGGKYRRDERERARAMRLFQRTEKSATMLRDEVDLAEAKQRVYRLAKELEAAALQLEAKAAALTQKANELKEELGDGG